MSERGVVKSERSYVALYRTTGVALWRAIYVYSGGSREIADDAVAEAFARAIQHDNAIRRPEAWLYRTAFHIAAAELRQTRFLVEVPGLAHAERRAGRRLRASGSAPPGRRCWSGR